MTPDSPGSGDSDADHEHHEAREMRFNTVPNRITLVRMAFVPVVVGLLTVRKPDWDLAAALTFGLAAATDWVDGYLARTRKDVTIYGKLMDPLADKFLVACSLIMLQELGRIHFAIVMLLICREIAITGLRALASAEGLIIPASPGAKWKTVTQMVAIPFIMVEQGLFGIPLFQIGQILLYASLAMSLWSAKDYVVDFFRALAERRREKAEKRRAKRLAKLGITGDTSKE